MHRQFWRHNLTISWLVSTFLLISEFKPWLSLTLESRSGCQEVAKWLHSLMTWGLVFVFLSPTQVYLCGLATSVGFGDNYYRDGFLNQNQSCLNRVCGVFLPSRLGWWVRLIVAHDQVWRLLILKSQVGHRNYWRTSVTSGLFFYVYLGVWSGRSSAWHFYYFLVPSAKTSN